LADFITLSCPSCGGKLHITPDIDRFACAHCGNEHLVKRTGGVVALQPLADSLSGLKHATERTASELALRRLSDELAGLKTARAQAQNTIEECQGTLHERERARRELIKSAITLALGTILIFLWPLPLQLGGVIGSLSSAQPDDLIVWLVPPVLVAFVAVATIQRKMAAPVLKIRREQIETDLAAAHESVRSAVEAISSLDAEQAHYRGLVSLRK
jgi:F0F1-type ATP synthase membrane subunit b/b'